MPGFFLEKIHYFCYMKEFQKKFREGDYYLDENGYRVFTEQYLLRRGYCCKAGCRHCPYGYDKKTGKIKRK